MAIPPEVQSILELARLSPSIHNTQMWKFKIERGEFSIHLSEEYLVPIADPEYRDTWVSLGIQTDIIQNLIKAFGGESNIKVLQSELTINPALPVLSIKFNEAKLTEPKESNYIELLKKRRSYRGPFQKSDLAPTINTQDIFIITDSDQLKNINNTYHKCAANQSLNKGYMNELRRWVKLSKDEAGFGTEGLDHISLDLNGFETFLAKLFLNDKWVMRFSKLGLHGLLTDESKGFKNMAGVAIKSFQANKLTPEILIQEGRAYISTWLSLVEQGFEACPISTLIDLPEGHDLLKKTLNLPGDSLFSLALRFGKSDGSVVRRVRRPIEDWLIS